MTDIILQRGQCVYWGCENWTQSSYCREHMPTRCRVCNCEPYGSRGLTYGMCIKHYKQWARHKSSQRETILAQDRKRSKRRTEQRRAQREAERAALAEAARAAMPPAERLAEVMEIGGWISGACISGRQRLELVK